MSIHVPDEVIRRAQQGDREAQSEIIQTFRSPIAGTVSRFLRPRFPNDVDDAVNEIFLRMLAHLGDYDFARNVRFSTWIYAFSRNYCFDLLKRRRVRTTSLNAINRRSDEEFAWEFPADVEPPPEAAGRTEFEQAVGAVLTQWPDATTRRIFDLYAYDGLDFRQIARRLELPLGTIKSKYYRACDKLRVLLAAHRPRARAVG